MKEKELFSYLISTFDILSDFTTYKTFEKKNLYLNIFKKIAYLCGRINTPSRTGARGTNQYIRLACGV